eukprot:jgi/Mesvir1/8196/Mv12491-RA.1
MTLLERNLTEVDSSGAPLKLKRSLLQTNCRLCGGIIPVGVDLWPVANHVVDKVLAARSSGELAAGVTLDLFADDDGLATDIPCEWCHAECARSIYGELTRHNCPVCKHWVRKGSCLYGDNCFYRHPPLHTVQVVKQDRRSWGGARRRLLNESAPRIFRHWLIDTFGRALLSSGTGILDVGGGMGELSFQFVNLNGIPSTVVDPRPLDTRRFHRRLLRGYYHFNPVFAKYTDVGKQGEWLPATSPAAMPAASGDTAAVPAVSGDPVPHASTRCSPVGPCPDRAGSHQVPGGSYEARPVAGWPRDPAILRVFFDAALVSRLTGEAESEGGAEAEAEAAVDRTRSCSLGDGEETVHLGRCNGSSGRGDGSACGPGLHTSSSGGGDLASADCVGRDHGEGDEVWDPCQGAGSHGRDDNSAKGSGRDVGMRPQCKGVSREAWGGEHNGHSLDLPCGDWDTFYLDATRRALAVNWTVKGLQPRHEDGEGGDAPGDGGVHAGVGEDGCSCGLDRESVDDLIITEPAGATLGAGSLHAGAPGDEAGAVTPLEAFQRLLGCSIVVALHADQGTEPAIDFALATGKPFACVPCCVYSKQFPKRYLAGKQVSTFEDFMTYLKAKDPSIQETVLGFEGKNRLLYRLVPGEG